jgi:hypothetical protein
MQHAGLDQALEINEIFTFRSLGSGHVAGGRNDRPPSGWGKKMRAKRDCFQDFMMPPSCG